MRSFYTMMMHTWMVWKSKWKEFEYHNYLSSTTLLIDHHGLDLNIQVSISQQKTLIFLLGIFWYNFSIYLYVIWIKLINLFSTNCYFEKVFQLKTKRNHELLLCRYSITQDQIFSVISCKNFGVIASLNAQIDVSCVA